MQSESLLAAVSATRNLHGLQALLSRLGCERGGVRGGAVEPWVDDAERADCDLQVVLAVLDRAEQALAFALLVLQRRLRSLPFVHVGGHRQILLDRQTPVRLLLRLLRQARVVGGFMLRALRLRLDL